MAHIQKTRSEHMTDNHYDNLMSSIMNDEKKALILKKNIYFVGKYLPKIEGHIDDETDREIAYRELGTIAFSCIELLLKTVLLNLNKECNSRKCNKCVFRCKIRTIEGKKIFDVLDLLYDSQVLWLKENEIDEMLWLREQRNGVHLSKDLSLDVESKTYDKKYVQRTINFFIHLLNSLGRDMSYFYWILYCYEQADGEKAKRMMKIRQNRQMLLCRSRLLHISQKVFNNQELTDKERWAIERIEIPKYIDLDEIIEYINNLVDNYIKRCEQEKKEIIDRTVLLKRITKYLKKESIKRRIMTYNENKKTEIKQ